METEEDSVYGWRKSSFGSVSEPSTRHHIVQAWPGWWYQLFREIEKSELIQGQIPCGGNMTSLQQSQMDLLSSYFIKVLTLPEGWREADDPAIFKKEKKSKFGKPQTSELTLDLENVQNRLLTKNMCPSEKAPVKRLSHARLTLFLLWNV